MTPMTDLEVECRTELVALIYRVRNERYKNAAYREDDGIKKRLAEINLELERAFQRIWVNREPGFS
jgi:hypothetical protein